MSEKNADIRAILNLLPFAALYVCDNTVSTANSAAAALWGQCEKKQLNEILGDSYAKILTEFTVSHLRLNLSGVMYTADISVFHDGFVILFHPADYASSLTAANKSVNSSIRSMLALIMTSLDLLRPATEHTDAAKYTSIINKNACGLLRMTNSLEMLASDGSDRFSPENGDLTETIHEILDHAKPYLETLGSSVSFRHPKNGVYFAFDRLIVERVIYHLISNIIKYAGDKTDLVITLSEKSPSVLLAFYDSGKGMLPAAVTDAVNMRDTNSGANLGLMYVHKAATLHGGAVFIESVPDSGTSVIVTFNKEIKPSERLRSPRTDYSGGYDTTLIELSDVLSYELY